MYEDRLLKDEHVVKLSLTVIVSLGLGLGLIVSNVAASAYVQKPNEFNLSVSASQWRHQARFKGWVRTGQEPSPPFPLFPFLFCLFLPFYLSLTISLFPSSFLPSFPYRLSPKSRYSYRWSGNPGCKRVFSLNFETTKQ